MVELNKWVAMQRVVEDEHRWCGGYCHAGYTKADLGMGGYGSRPPFCQLNLANSAYFVAKTANPPPLFFYQFPHSAPSFFLSLALKLAQSIRRLLWVQEVASSSHVSTNALVKMSVLEIPLDKELTANLSQRNLYKTLGADPGCDGLIWPE